MTTREVKLARAGRLWAAVDGVIARFVVSLLILAYLLGMNAPLVLGAFIVTELAGALHLGWLLRASFQSSG